MATDAYKRDITTTAGSITATEAVEAILAPLASLKLTVFLLVFATFLTLVATLEQTRSDVYTVKMQHFNHVFVEVPFQTFFVPAWFPERQNIPGSIYLPSGFTVLVLMLINLTAAHVLRFRLKAKGGKLIVGLLVAVFAGFMTWAIIFNGPSAGGIQGAPPISWKSMWTILQIGVLGIALAAAYGFATLDKEKSVERLLLLLGSIVFLAGFVLTIVLGEKAFIGDSAMRILWQLTQATIAGLVAYVACVILFHRKAGIVLVHLGIAGLMFNEIYVTVTNEEHRMTIFEGQTVSTAVDIRATEMAIVDISDPEFDNITTIPGDRLRRGNLISSDELPFDVQCKQYYANSDIADRKSSKNNLATKGLGQMLAAIELPPSAGTDSEQVADFASAYVEIKNKSNNESLGTYLISQNLDEQKADAIEIDGKKYFISLRFKTNYKPYSLTLKDAQRENYLGTDTPRWYSSDVVLNDFVNDITSDQKIWMNNPLRYGGETFYQSGMDTLRDGRTYTVLQIVMNHGWMIPYVCCMFTVVGLIAQFGTSLMGFLEKTRKQGMIVTAKLAEPEPVKVTSGNPLHRWTPIVLIGVFGLWGVGEIAKARSAKVEKEGMRLDLLGQIPVTINGRVQPLDSVARNTARQLSNRENVLDGKGDKQPAIRWLADALFEAEGYLDYYTFRIEDTNVISSIQLPSQRTKDPDTNKRFRFTFKEMLTSEDKMRSLLPNRDEKDPKTWSQLEKRIGSVVEKMQRMYGMKLAMGRPESDDDDMMLRFQDAGRTPSSPLIPLIIPNDDEENPWLSMMVLQDRAWLGEIAEKFGKDNTNDLATVIIEQEVIPPIREETIRTRIVQQFISDPEFRKIMEEQIGESNPQVLAETMLKNFDNLPGKERLIAAQSPLVDAMIAQQMPNYVRVLENQIATMNGGKGKINRDNLELVEMLRKLKPAYNAKEADKFNSTVTAYLTKVDEVAPQGLRPTRIKSELYYNELAPFYLAGVFFLLSLFPVLIGWVFPKNAKSWNRAALWFLVMGLGFQILGLMLRVVISGRPPVTNLYSSVIFVTAAFIVLCLIIEVITKQGIGAFIAGLGGFAAYMWSWSMEIASGDTFTVLVAVLDTQFWLSTHVVCISIGYAATFCAGLLGAAYIIAAFATPAFIDKDVRRIFANVIYGIVCFGLLCSFFGTVLGGLWGDDSWGRFWGWDPKENGALMIVLWNAVVLHARWGGIVKEKGVAALAAFGNVVVLWSWKGVNELGVGLHAYAGTEDATTMYILLTAGIHCLIAAVVVIFPTMLWRSYAQPTDKLVG